MMTEGTYPFGFGGVSVWCDQLIRGMPGYEFRLVAITATEAEQVVWSLPDNVTAVHKVLLWGSSPTGSSAGRRHTLPSRLLRELIDVVLDSSAQACFADTLRELFEFSSRGNLSAGLASEKAVQFLSEAWRDRWSGAAQFAPNLHDAVTALQLLEHCLRPLSYSPVQADIGHAVTNGLGVLPALAAKWQYGTPLLLTEHGIYLREQYLQNRKSPYRWPVKEFYLGFMRHLCALGYNEAAMVTPGNVYNRRWEERLGAQPTHIRTVYNGVEPDNFPALEGEPKVPTISWVGRVDPIKDLETLLRAFSLVHRDMPEARLRMFGSPPKGRESYLQRCRALATELGIDEVATFEGRVENIRDAYDAGCIVVLSSVSEGFPYSVIEAMTCGRTCVATDVGGVTELVGDTGLVVPPRSPARMAQACLTLLRDDELRHRLGAAARVRALERFTVDGAISTFDEIYSFIGAGRPVPIAVPEPDAYEQPELEADDESDDLLSDEPDDLLPWEAPDDREHPVDAARSAAAPDGKRKPGGDGGRHRRGFQAARYRGAVRAVRGGVRIRSRSAGDI
jgi:polysaccharide biosynthesis protein PelF